MSTTHTDNDGALRTVLLAILTLGILGTASELYLLDHMEETAQWVPLVVLCASLVSVVWVGVAASRRSLRFMQAVMSVTVLSGPVGLLQHYRGNAEFELEMYPSMGGMELVWEALTGATPALAPGTMILLGLLGLAYCYRHPKLAPSADLA